MKTWKQFIENINALNFTLTGNELVHLGWDDPGLKNTDPELYTIVYKIRTKQPITKEEFAIIYEEIHMLNTFGGNPSGNAIAKRLMHKVNKYINFLKE